MRTLVISDLHLGRRDDRDRLREAAAREALVAALAEIDRLVLLGDVIELRQGPVHAALSAALPVLGAIGAALRPGAEVVVVPGNHDHHLLDGWRARRSAAGSPPPLGTESAVDWRDGEPLAEIAAALRSGGASVRGAYPGVWLSVRTWATHGHYLDAHTTIPMFERLGVGTMARVLGKPAARAASAEDYESILTPVYAWLHATAQNAASTRPDGASAHMWTRLQSGGGVRSRALRAGFPLVIAGLNRTGIGPLKRDLDDASLRRAPLTAIGEVLQRLSVDAEHVVFGHTHRAGPLAGNDRSEWRGPTGASLTNIGCWVDEPAFLGASPQTSPYRAGFAARIDDDAPPELVNLLSRGQ